MTGVKSYNSKDKMFADHMKGDSYTQHTYKNHTIDWIPKQISTNPHMNNPFKGVISARWFTARPLI